MLEISFKDKFVFFLRNGSIIYRTQVVLLHMNFSFCILSFIGLPSTLLSNPYFKQIRYIFNEVNLYLTRMLGKL